MGVPGEVSRTVGGMMFGISPVPGRAGLHLFHKLSRSVFPAMGSAMVAFQDGKGMGERAAAIGRVLERALPKMFETLTQAELDDLVNSLLSTTVLIAEGRRTEVLNVLDVTFRGKTATLLKLLYAAAEVSFGDFFEGSLAEYLKKLAEEVRSELSSDSPKTPPTSGPSGVSSSPE